MRFRPKIIVLTLIILAAVVPFLKAYVIANIYDVPSWYLVPRFILLSGVPLERKMNVTVQPLVPFSLGDSITVKVVDAENGTALDGAAIKVSKDGISYAPMSTDSNGIVMFEYAGEPTIIEVSKLNYETVTKVIPRIPDTWIRAAFTQWITNIVTWIITLSSSAFTIIKFRSEFKIRIKTDSKSKEKRKNRNKTTPTT